MANIAYEYIIIVYIGVYRYNCININNCYGRYALQIKKNKNRDK